MTNSFNRDDFMEFFRDEDKLATLSADDRHEIFHSILPGSSDCTAELLNEILMNYNIAHLKVISLDLG